MDLLPAHKERAHSRFSASGSERWLSCAASVALEEKSPPSIDSLWSREGTLAHEVLECLLRRQALPNNFAVTNEMVSFCQKAADKIRAVHQSFGGFIAFEKRVHATFIHEEMFGTLDCFIAGNNRTLHIMDFKYGQGHVVSPIENTQLIQYALSVAESYDWETHFDYVKMWILQPRAGGEWAKSWMIPMSDLEKKWWPLWSKGVARVERGGHKPIPGRWCHWCRAKMACPAKVELRVERMVNEFEKHPITNEVTNGVEEKGGGKSKAEASEQARKKGRARKGESETCAREENSFVYRKAIRGHFY